MMMDGKLVLLKLLKYVIQRLKHLLDMVLRLLFLLLTLINKDGCFLRLREIRINQK